MMFQFFLDGRRRITPPDSPQVGLVWDDTYQLVLLVSLGPEQCSLATDLQVELNTSVVIDLGGGCLVLGRIVDNANCQLTVSFAERLGKGESCRSVPRNLLLAAGAPRHAVSLARKDAYPCETAKSWIKRKYGGNPFQLSSRLMRSAAIGVVLWSSVATSETYSALDISAGVQYDSDPFLRNGQDTETASVQASVRPSLGYEDPTFQIGVVGFVNHSEYFDRYDSDTAWGLYIDGSQQFDPLTLINFSASAVTLGRGDTSFTSGSLPIPDGGLPNPDPGLPDPEVPDLSELGSSTKTRQLNAMLGIERKLNELETLNVGVALRDASTTGELTDVPDNSDDFRTGILMLGYKRNVSSQTTVLADVQGSLVNYNNTNRGDGFVVNAAGGLETALSNRITAKATVGISYSKSELPNGTHDEAMTPSFSASACRQAENTNSCLSATRAVQPTTSGRLRKVTAFGATHSWRLNADDDAALQVRYARNDDFQVADEVDVTNQVFAVGGSYRRKIANRLHVAFSTGLERRFGETGRDGANNVFVNVGLNYRIGASGD